MDISSGRLFPLHFQLLGVGLGVISVVLWSINILLAIALMFVCLLIFTSSSGFSIDKESRRYREYYSFFSLKFGSWEAYSTLDIIFINSSKVTQRVHSSRTLQSTNFGYVEYNGYLKLDSGTKVHVLSTKNKEVLFRQLNDLASYLSIELVDYTT